MADRVDGLAPEVLRQQLMSERTARERLQAELLALKARLMAGDPPDLLIDVASVILDAEHAMAASPSSGALDERVSTGKPGSRTPSRDQGPSRAWRRFRSRVDGAVNGWTAEKERNWEREPKDPREYARVWCCRKACPEYQISKPRYVQSRKLGFVELSRSCNGRVEDEPCGHQMTVRT